MGLMSLLRRAANKFGNEDYLTSQFLRPTFQLRDKLFQSSSPIDFALPSVPTPLPVQALLNRRQTALVQFSAAHSPVSLVTLYERREMIGNPGPESESMAAREIVRTPGAGNLTIDPNVCARVHELLLVMYPPGPPLERRNDRRYPYPQLIRLTPVDEGGKQILSKTIAVVGKTLSERGVGFYHPQPLPYRRVVASFHAGDDRWLGLLVDLSWCRFTGLGWYESGGRFLQSVPAIIAEAATTD
jgi:hypothetical protein